MADRMEAIEKFVIRGELHSTMLQYLLFGMDFGLRPHPPLILTYTLM